MSSDHHWQDENERSKPDASMWSGHSCLPIKARLSLADRSRLFGTVPVYRHS